MTSPPLEVPNPKKAALTQVCYLLLSGKVAILKREGVRYTVSGSVLGPTTYAPIGPNSDTSLL